MNMPMRAHCFTKGCLLLLAAVCLAGSVAARSSDPQPFGGSGGIDVASTENESVIQGGRQLMQDNSGEDGGFSGGEDGGSPVDSGNTDGSNQPGDFNQTPAPLPQAADGGFQGSEGADGGNGGRGSTTANAGDGGGGGSGGGGGGGSDSNAVNGGNGGGGGSTGSSGGGGGRDRPNCAFGQYVNNNRCVKCVSKSSTRSADVLRGKLCSKPFGVNSPDSCNFGFMSGLQVKGQRGQPVANCITPSDTVIMYLPTKGFKFFGVKSTKYLFDTISLAGAPLTPIAGIPLTFHFPDYINGLEVDALVFQGAEASIQKFKGRSISLNGVVRVEGDYDICFAATAEVCS